MRAKIGLAVLLLSVLFWTPGGPAAQLAGQRLEPLEEPPAAARQRHRAAGAGRRGHRGALNSRGWTGSLADDTSEDLTGDVLAAYTLAVAVAPPGCHLTTPLLAAIGQVESGNLAGHTLDGHRVSPAILGPVLDGKQYRAVADTDAGRWDRNQVWDRALGPMQIIPSTWRSSVSTWTATASATRRTSTTPPVPRWSTCAPAAATSRPPAGCARRSSPTTTPWTTSVRSSPGRPSSTRPT